VELAASGCVPGGSKRNLAYAEAVVRFDDAISEPLRLVLADAQTSGGLLLFLAAERADEALAMLLDEGVEHAAIVGEVTEKGPAAIEVVPS
jgi:selenide,water dikinase